MKLITTLSTQYFGANERTFVTSKIKQVNKLKMMIRCTLVNVLKIILVSCVLFEMCTTNVRKLLVRVVRNFVPHANNCFFFVIVESSSHVLIKK